MEWQFKRFFFGVRQRGPSPLQLNKRVTVKEIWKSTGQMSVTLRVQFNTTMKCPIWDMKARNLSLIVFAELRNLRALSSLTCYVKDGRLDVSLIAWTELVFAASAFHSASILARSRGVSTGWRRWGAQVEVGALRWRRWRAALLRWQILGAGGRGWRVGVRVWVKVHVVLVFAVAAMSCRLPSARGQCQPGRLVVGVVVTIADIGAARSSRGGSSTDWMVGSEEEEVGSYLKSASGNFHTALMN